MPTLTVIRQPGEDGAKIFVDQVLVGRIVRTDARDYVVMTDGAIPSLDGFREDSPESIYREIQDRLQEGDLMVRRSSIAPSPE